MAWNTVKEAVPKLELSVEMIYKLCAAGKIRHRPSGRKRPQRGCIVSGPCVTGYCVGDHGHCGPDPALQEFRKNLRQWCRIERHRFCLDSTAGS